MATLKPILRSFAGGEITEELYGRLDLDKFQTGVAEALNFIVLPHGPLAARPGFAYTLTTKYGVHLSRVIPFAWSTEQTVAIELGLYYARFHVNGQTLLDPAGVMTITNITRALPSVATYTGPDPSNGEWLLLSIPVGMTELNGRYVGISSVNTVAKTFVLYDLDGSQLDTSTFSAFVVAGCTGTPVYEIATPYSSEDVFDIHFSQSSDVVSLTHPKYAPRELRRLGAASWTVTTPTFLAAISPPTAPTATPTGAGAVNYSYVVTAIAYDTYEESVASAVATCANDLTIAGHINTVGWTPLAVPNTYAGFNIYKLKGGSYGWVGRVLDGVATFVDDNIAPDMSKTPPVISNPFAAAGDYPSTVTYAEQRRWFGATDNRPQHIFGTRSATESNFGQSVPLQDDDAIIVGLKGTNQNRVRHLVPLNDLIALTAGDVRVVRSVDGTALTPLTIEAKRQSGVGAANVQPALAESACLYAQDQGSHIRELSIQTTSAGSYGYSNSDISILAPHLFDGFTIRDMAFSNTSTLPVLWVVRSDGVLLGMTYVPGQNVKAWHQHTTDGRFESVCCVDEGGESVLYAVVYRNLKGRETRYIERMHTRRFVDQADAFHVDSGASYDGAATNTVTGLWHLEGMPVAVLADGAYIDGLVVTNGSITLDVAASKIHVGLPYTARVETLPVSLETTGFGQGSVKNVNKVHVRVSRSGGFFIGPRDGALVETRTRRTEPFDVPPKLVTGRVPVNIQPLWSEDGAIVIEQRAPVPLTVLSMVLEVTEGG